MDQAALTPTFLPANPGQSSDPRPGSARLCAFLQHPRTTPLRSGKSPFAAPGSSSSREALIEGLRRRVEAIERPRLEQPRAWSQAASPPAHSHSPHEPAPEFHQTGTAPLWSLGETRLDRLPGASGFDQAACHEVKPLPATAGAQAAAVAFALALAGRRAAMPGLSGSILWCTTHRAIRENGVLHGPGLARFGICLTRLIVVETQREDDALWAFEEGLRCGSLALVAGCFHGLALTPARRLALAARDGRTPGLVLTHPAAPSSGAMASRWRIGPAPSAPHPFDTRAPGAARFAVTLEKSRGAPASAHAPMLLEWSDETHRFHMAAAMADRETDAARPRVRAG